MSGHRIRVIGPTFAALLPVALALAAGTPSHAAEEGWSFSLEPMSMEVYGHDQHVLTVHQIDLDSTPRLDDRTAVNLDSDSGAAYRFELQHRRGRWGLGLDFFWFNTSQSAPVLTASASGPIDRVIFEVADRSFTSEGPDQVLAYNTIGDTDLATWTVDLYGILELAETPQSRFELQLGVRNGDFDNDYRAVVGVQGVGGRRLDASSNYGRMIGPVVGLAGKVELGRNHLQGYLGQSVLLGTAELRSGWRDFTGPLESATDVEGVIETTFASETFRVDRDVAFPITEARLKWAYQVSERFAVGLGANTSAWWDVAVPPGVVPIDDGDEALHENTLVFFGVAAVVKVTF